MSTLQHRLKAALAAKGKSQSELARACGITRGAVNQWLTGTTKALEGSNLTNAAKFLGVSPHWLATGQGPMEGIAQVRSSVIHLGPSAVPVQRPSGQPVPLLATVPAGNWREVVDAYAMGGADSYVMALGDVGAHGFALRVEGNSIDGLESFDSMPTRSHSLCAWAEVARSPHKRLHRRRESVRQYH